MQAEYADESRLAARAAAWSLSTGPSARGLVVAAVAELEPDGVVDVGCGRGELAERIAAETGATVVAIDQSPRMVELTRARGIDAVVADVQALPFEDGSFDCAVAAWMLYHVPDLDRGLSELVRVLRPGGRVVAVTNGERNLSELWDLFAGQAQRDHAFSAEDGARKLSRHFDRVERRDVNGTITFPDWEAARRYVESSVTRRDLADRLPRFDGPLVCRRLVSVFVADRAT